MAGKKLNTTSKGATSPRKAASVAGELIIDPIVQLGHKSLRTVSKGLTPEEIAGVEVQNLLKKMTTVLAKCPDGVALAAPQLGVNLRIFVVSPKAFEDFDINKHKLVYINPRVTKKSVKKVELEEGCLSVRNVYGLIKRHEKVTVVAEDERGKTFTRGASGLLAEIFQHEIDHLEAKLFVDKATQLRELAHD